MKAPRPVPAPGPLPRVSFAQNQEDILLDRIFRDEPPGTFIDVGANHPSLDSNTHFFYLRGWRGVNLEPIPRQHGLFVSERPGDLNLAVAASEEDGELTFYEIASERGETGHSTVSAEVAEEHRQPGFRVAAYTVRARSLGSLIREYGLEPPEFLSLDVESYEAAVLRGIPLDAWRPKVLVVEALHPLSHEEAFADWEPLLLGRGYLLGATNGVNRFYLRDDLADRLPRLRTPVNCTDQYVRQEAVALRQEADRARGLADEIRRECDRLLAAMDGERRAARERLAEARAEFDAARAALAAAEAEGRREAAALNRELEEHRRAVAILRRLLAETQGQLRPYRMLDRLGLLNAAHGWARRAKRAVVHTP